MWDANGPVQPAQHDFVAASLSKKGTAAFGHKGDTPGEAGARTMVIALKDGLVDPYANTSGYPNAFPRPLDPADIGAFP